MNRLSLMIATAGLVLTLSACSDLREDLGLGRNPPDEFAVVDRAPLSMPPDFALRPPSPGAQRVQETDVRKQASETLFGPASNMSATPASSAELELLAQTGADKADPNIRDIVDRETSQKVVTNDHLVDSLLTWVRSSDEKPAATVDAAAETARIKEAKEKGEPLNQSATPVIERDKSGWLGL